MLIKDRYSYWDCMYFALYSIRNNYQKNDK